MLTSALDDVASVEGFLGCEDRARTSEADEAGEVLDGERRGRQGRRAPTPGVAAADACSCIGCC